METFGEGMYGYISSFMVEGGSPSRKGKVRLESNQNVV
jgi:hypothetical protein